MIGIVCIYIIYKSYVIFCHVRSQFSDISEIFLARKLVHLLRNRRNYGPQKYFVRKYMTEN